MGGPGDARDPGCTVSAEVWTAGAEQVRGSVIQPMRAGDGSRQRQTPPTTDPEVRRLIHALAVRVIGPRQDQEFLLASLVTNLNAEVNDFARHWRTDASEGHRSLVEMRQAAEKRRVGMENTAWPAQVQPATVPKAETSSEPDAVACPALTQDV